jgi:hypothetical protein
VKTVLFKRLALWLSAAGIVAMSLVMVPSAAAAGSHREMIHPTVTAGSTSAQATDAGLLSNCPITSRSGHSGAYICETSPAYVTWYNSLGQIVAFDDVVIGTDYRIYDDPGSGWRWLQGGVSAPNAGGIFIVSNDTIAVIGTDNFGYCNRTTAPGQWTGWGRC